MKKIKQTQIMINDHGYVKKDNLQVFTTFSFLINFGLKLLERYSLTWNILHRNFQASFQYSSFHLQQCQGCETVWRRENFDEDTIVCFDRDQKE